MKITRGQLRRIIQEELSIISERVPPGQGDVNERSAAAACSYMTSGGESIDDPVAWWDNLKNAVEEAEAGQGTAHSPSGHIANARYSFFKKYESELSDKPRKIKKWWKESGRDDAKRRIAMGRSDLRC